MPPLTRPSRVLTLLILIRCLRFALSRTQFSRRTRSPQALVLLTLALVAARADLPVTPEIGPAAGWVVATPWSAPEQARENSSGEDFLLIDEQTRLATQENYHHNVYQIVTEGGRQDGAQVTFYFDPSYQQLTIHQLKLIRGTEVSDRLDAGKIQILQQERNLDSQLYNGQRSALVILDDVRIGDIIDIAYTLRGANPVFSGKFIDTTFIEWGVPVRHLNYRLLVPPGRTILAKTYGSGQPLFSSQILEGEQEQVWQRKNLPIIELEDNVPSSHVPFSFIDLSEFGSWSDVVRWAEPLYALDDLPHPLLDAAVADIRSQAQLPGQQAVAALAFVQQQIRYLGIEMGPGSHRPSEPEEVLRRRFGDCKDKARLLTALLRRLGLNASPALVHSSRREALRDRLPTPYAFDHVVVALEFEKKHFILDPTLSYQRGDQLEMRHIGRYGPYLRIAPASDNLEQAELRASDTNHTVLQEHFKVTALDQPATLTITTIGKGYAANSLRARFATNTLEQIGREYLDYYTHYYPGITQLKPIEFKDDPATNTYTTTEQYRVAQLFTLDAETNIQRAELQPGAIWDYARTPNLAQRTQPYALSHPLKLEESITIDLPKDWKVTPGNEQITDPAFTLASLVANVSQRTILLKYTWESKADQVAPARLAEYSANCAKVRKILGFELTWGTPKPTATQPTPEAAPDDFPLNWPMILLAFGWSLFMGFFAWRLARKRNSTPPPIPLIDPAKPLDPYSSLARAPDLEGLGGWLILIGFGLILRPFFILKIIHDSRFGYFHAVSWENLTTTSSEAYQPYFSLIAPLEMMFAFTLLWASLLMPVMFFRRSHLFPRTFQIYLGGVIAWTIFTICDWSLLNQSEPIPFENYTALFQAIVYAAVWIPYFQVSRRVKATFTR